MIGRRLFLGTAAGAALAGATPAVAPAATRRRGSAGTFRWLGTSGWRITVDTTRIADHPGKPQTILVTHTHWEPVHRDDFQVELSNPPVPEDRKRLDRFVAAVRAVAPRTRVLLPEYLTPYTFAG